MFYSKNSFQLWIEYPDTDGTLPQSRHWLWTKPGRDEYELLCLDWIPWHVLKGWLKLVHQGAVHVKDIDTKNYKTEDAVSRALTIAKNYKGLSWRRASYQLEGFRQRIVSAGKRGQFWKDDYVPKVEFPDSEHED